MLSGAYSFLDVQATISGPNGTVSLGQAANAEEGFTIQFAEDRDRILYGADGSGMHSLNPVKGGQIIVRLLKTSPANAQLNAMYDADAQSSLTWGQNIFVVTNPVTGDDYTCQGVAFVKFPDNSYAKEAGILEWRFNATQIDPVLGSGILAGA